MSKSYYRLYWGVNSNDDNGNTVKIDISMEKNRNEEMIDFTACQEKIVVACKDFTADGKKLMEFAHLKNTCVDSEQNGYGTELSSIMKAIDEQSLMEPQKHNGKPKSARCEKIGITESCQELHIDFIDHNYWLLFDKEPNLNNTPVFIHFISSNPIYDKTYDFGVIGIYK